MPKIIKKIKNKLPGQPEHKTEKEKLEERREEILAQGRKYKYPMQFAKHRLVFITIGVSLAALIAAGVLGWVALYKTQNTSDLLYRITTVLPVPVAKIDGENVRYSDYLMIFRSSITPVEQQNGTISEDEDDTKSVRDFYKRTALTEAENYAYAIKLAKQLDIKVTDDMIDQAFDEHRKVGGTERSKESFLKVVKDNFDLTETEYRRMLYLSLVKIEVSKKIDSKATKLADEALAKVKSGASLADAAKSLDLGYEETGDLIDVMNVDGGRSTLAYSMEKGQTSDVFVSTGGDCYYIIKVNDKAEGRVNYSSIIIPFTEFDARLKNVREENRVEEYIEFPAEEQAEENQEEQGGSDS